MAKSRPPKQSLNKSTDNRYIIKHRTNDIRSDASTRHIQFGVIIFMLIFAYLLFVFISFAVRDKVNYTIIEPGQLENSKEFQGLVIRDEMVIYTASDGALRYELSEGERVESGSPLFHVYTNPEEVEKWDEEILTLANNLEVNEDIAKEQYDFLGGRIKNYLIQSNNKDFGFIYEVKPMIENDIRNIRQTIILNSDTGNLATINSLEDFENKKAELIETTYAPISGTVSYNIDGYESLVDVSAIDQLNYYVIDTPIETTNDPFTTKVSQGKPVCKIVNNLFWYILIEIDDEYAKFIEDARASYPNMTVELVDKKSTINVKALPVKRLGDRTFVLLEINGQMRSVLSDRTVGVKFKISNFDGLKVPESAVVQKDFFKVPIDFFLKNNKMILLQGTDENNESMPVRIKPSAFTYDDDEAFVFISGEGLKEGDVIAYTSVEDSTDKTTPNYFTLETPIPIDGVYNVNKGFALFKLIKTKYRTQDYRIVEKGTPYGLNAYDHVATEGDRIVEYQTIH